jgi:hypothetical protein
MAYLYLHMVVWVVLQAKNLEDGVIKNQLARNVRFTSWSLYFQGRIWIPIG